ncbi:glycine-rich domain-containing protein [Mucilaginibacter sp. 22184]|uniref:glycine-rich domain-containing protein n=1 Tax=Mucilaginibacter sp. 22184 TaxID=3453887 RepID=UPI003F83B965
MTPEQSQLWQKIQNFQLDNPQSAFKFSDRLARENGWNLQYTLRVIEEYKKFIFLCCISQNGVTPSDAVDQAWHLHLTFTHSYWIDLCRDTLQTQVHHNPTKGGDTENTKYDGYYTDTKQLYKQTFDGNPPADIWPANQQRFSDINFQRVNISRYWLLKKPEVGVRTIVPLLLILCLGIFIRASYGAMPLMCMIVLMIIYAIWGRKDNKKGDNNGNADSGGSGCTADWSHSNHHNGSDHHGCHSGDSGCSSGCSGCSFSGCSGCGSSD